MLKPYRGESEAASSLIIFTMPMAVGPFRAATVAVPKSAVSTAEDWLSWTALLSGWLAEDSLSTAEALLSEARLEELSLVPAVQPNKLRHRASARVRDKTRFITRMVLSARENERAAAPGKAAARAKGEPAKSRVSAQLGLYNPRVRMSRRGAASAPWEKGPEQPLTFARPFCMITKKGAAAAPGEECIKMEYGLQLFSVRDMTERDMEGALRQVAEMGYRSVEFAGFFGHSAQEIKGWLDKYGLTASGTHTGMSELTGDKLQETIAYHQAIGCRNLIVPYESFATKGDIDAFIQRVQQVQPQLNAAGITLHYHNHDHEFKPNQDGLIPEEELLARTNLLLEVDTYWVYAAGKDPVAFLQEHKDRIRVIHLKDGKGGDACASLGQGIAPVAQVRQAAIQLGLEMVVESEGLEPTGLEEVRRCMDFLRSQDQKDGN